jgi:hypothetical protein
MHDLKLRVELERLINNFSLENQSDTPDFILAQFLLDSLAAWDRSTRLRETWYGRDPKPAPWPVGYLRDPVI